MSTFLPLARLYAFFSSFSRFMSSIFTRRYSRFCSISFRFYSGLPFFSSLPFIKYYYSNRTNQGVSSHTNHNDLCTKLFTISREFSPWSMGTKCPASLTVRSSSRPTTLLKPATLPFTFHGASKVYLSEGEST